MSIYVLDPLVAVLPTTNGATRSQVESAAAAPANGPKYNYTRLVFPDASDKFAIWNLPIPADFAAGFPFVVTLWWGAAVVVNNVLWTAGVYNTKEAVTDLDTTAAFPTVDNFAAIVVPGTVGQWKKSTLSLTTPANAASGDFLSCFIGRNGDGAGDTAVGNSEVYAGTLEYTDQ